jgi:hypothetical protein
MSSLPLAPVSHRRRILLAVVIGAIGCGGTGESCLDIFPDEPDGLYIRCQGEGALYYINNRGQKIDKVTLCLGEPFLNETGTGTGGEIDLADWDNDTEDIDYLRTLCEAKCREVTWDANNSECSPNSGNIWHIENHAGISTPDVLMEINDPWRLTCQTWLADLAPAPWETPVVPPGAPWVWPGTDEYVSLDCADFATCAAQFDASIGEGLYYDDTAEFWGANMGFADYLATSSMGSSQFEVTILNPDGTPTSDMHDVNGRIEYSAPDCGEPECPFYLANLTLSNMEDNWTLYPKNISGEGVVISMSGLSVQLRRPTLGVWNTETNQVYMGAKRVDMYVLVTHQIGVEPPVEGGYLVTNGDAIFAELDGEGGLQILNLVADGGFNVKFEADVAYDTLAGEPPTADLGMGSTVMAPNDLGLPVSQIMDASSDPDDDIDSKIWFVDGVVRTSSYVVPLGSHEFALRVIDQRGATDVDASLVEVLSP